MKHQITYLLNASRIPDHFYALVKGLSGRDAMYKNPGTSLRSFAMAGTNIMQEFVEVDDEMQAVLKECEAFTDDENVYETINHALRTQPYDILEKILEIGKNPNAVKEVMKRLNSMNRRVEETWDILKNATVAGQPKNFWSPAALEYRQSIIDLKAYASELAGHLDNLRERSQ